MLNFELLGRKISEQLPKWTFKKSFSISDLPSLIFGGNRQ